MAFGINNMYFIPYKKEFDFVFNVGLCMLLILLATGVFIIPLFAIIYLLLIPSFYSLSYILFFTNLECEDMMNTYIEIEEEVKIEKEQA